MSKNYTSQLYTSDSCLYFGENKIYENDLK